MFRKTAIGTAVLSMVIFVIAWGVMGVSILNGNYDTQVLTYIGLASLIGFFVSLIVLRWGSWKCPHCDKPRWINGRYCSYCGKEI